MKIVIMFIEKLKINNKEYILISKKIHNIYNIDYLFDS